MTVVFESGIAGSPQAWFATGRLLESDYQVVIHRRSRGGETLPVIAAQLWDALQKAGVPEPYLLVGHSFGALVVRQFADMFPGETAGILFVDGLPPTTKIARAHLLQGVVFASTAELLADFHVLGPLFPKLARRLRTVDWAVRELRKLPEGDRASVFAEWLTPGFYGDLARTLKALPANLRIACTIPLRVPRISLWSDYEDAEGQYVEGVGHWIQIEKPEVVAAAVRDLHAIIKARGV